MKSFLLWRVFQEPLRQFSEGPDDLGRGSSIGSGSEVSMSDNEYSVMLVAKFPMHLHLEDPAAHNDIDIG